MERPMLQLLVRPRESWNSLSTELRQPTWHSAPLSASWRQLCLRWCRNLDLITMRAYVTHSLTVRVKMSVYLLTYLLNWCFIKEFVCASEFMCGFVWQSWLVSSLTAGLPLSHLATDLSLITVPLFAFNRS